MMVACRCHHLGVVLKLAEKGAEFTEEHLRMVMTSENVEGVEKLRALHKIPLVSLLPSVFLGDRDPCTITDATIDYYSDELGREEFVKWAEEFQLVKHLGEKENEKAVQVLLDLGLRVTEEQVSTLISGRYYDTYRKGRVEENFVEEMGFVLRLSNRCTGKWNIIGEIEDDSVSIDTDFTVTCSY
jgi:hypothetical protein